MKRVMMIGAIAACMMGSTATSARAATSDILGRVSFALTLEQQALAGEPITPITIKFSTIKVKLTTKDVLAAFSKHYGNETYPVGAFLGWGVIDIPGEGDTVTQEGCIQVHNPLNNAVVRKIEPTVFKINPFIFFTAEEGKGALKSGTESLTSDNAKKRLSSLGGYNLTTGNFDLRMGGILLENVSIQDIGVQRILSASASMTVLGEGYANLGPNGVRYVLISGKITQSNERHYLDPMP